MLYENTCTTCAEQGKKVVYVGETGLSGFERQSQHQDDARLLKRHEKSHMRSHCKDDHPESNFEDIKFKFKVIRKIPSPFQRQIAEAINIRLRTRKGGEFLMNNKQEFSRCVLPELEVSMQDRIMSREITEKAKITAKKYLELKAVDEEGLINQKRARTNESSSREQPSYKKRRLGP